MPKVYAAGDQVTASDINAIVKTTGLYAVDSVGTDAYAITVSPVCGAYADGDVFRFRAGTANTGAATLAVSGLAAKAIKKNYNVALATGDILAGQMVTVQFDGPNDSFQMISTPAGPQTASGSFLYNRTSDSTNFNDDLTCTTGFLPSVIELQFMIQGHFSATETAHYAITAGIVTYNGTTQVGILRFINNYDSGNTDNLAPTYAAYSMDSTSFTDTTSPSAGSSSEVNSGAVKMVLSVFSVSSTGFVIRRRSEAGAGGGTNVARAAVVWKAWQ